MNSSNIEIVRINTTPTPTTDLNLNKNTVPLASTGATKLTFSIVGTTNNNKNTPVPNNNSIPSNTTPTTTATTATYSTTSTGPSNNKVSITRDVTRSVSANTLGNNSFIILNNASAKSNTSNSAKLGVSVNVSPIVTHSVSDVATLSFD